MGKFKNISIHPTAIMGKNVKLEKGVKINAYCIIGESFNEGKDKKGKIIIKKGATINHHSIIYNNVVIGEGTILDPFSRVGPNAKIGSNTHLLYGARVHEEVTIGDSCSIGGNCPDRTTFGDHVVHLGRIAHSYYYPFEDWDELEEPGPSLGSHVVVGVDALIIGPVKIGNNVFIFPKEIVRDDLPDDGIFRDSKWQKMPNWTKYLRMLGKISSLQSYSTKNKLCY